MLFEDKNGDGEILESADPELSEVLQRHYYYPFGMQMEGLWNGQTAPGMRYLYNGKELEEDLGLNWYAYGFRYYDAAIGRFTGVDPIADQFPWVSTFNYAENMVPMAIDLWGLQAWINKTAHYSDGSTSQEWVFDESKEPRQGVYTENLYFDSECNLTGGSSGTASYSDYPNEFPNQGNYSRADGKGLITLDWEGGITYGHAALQIGKSGFNMQGGGYLLGGSYNSSEGGSGYLLETNNMNLVAEVSFMGLGANYTNQFSPTDGLAENGSLSVVTPLPGLKKSEPLNLSGGIGTNNSSVFLGGEANVGFGIGFKLKAGISVNMQPRLTEFEKKEMESIR